MKKSILLVLLLALCQIVKPVNLERNNIFEISSIAYLVSFDTGERPDISKKVISPVEVLKYELIKNPDFRVIVEDKFKPFVNHEFVEYVRELEKKEEGVALNVMFELADALTFNKEEIVLKSGVDIDKITDSKCFKRKKEVEKYIRLLNSFYKDTDFENFVNDNSIYYGGCEVLSNAKALNANFNYFESFLLKGGKLNFVPLYSLGYNGAWILGDWNDDEITVVDGFECVDCRLNELSKSYPENSFIMFLCSNYANEFYEANKKSIENASIRVFDKYKTDNLDKCLFDTHQQLTKEWLMWVYVLDYARKTKMTDLEDYCMNSATNLKHIPWFESSLGRILKEDSDVESMNQRIIAYYMDLANNIVAEENDTM